jgi:hypothetical protein
MPAGTYTDRISGGDVVIAADGSMQVSIASWTAVAIDVKSKK